MKPFAAPALVRSPGLLHWVLPLMLVPLALTVLLSGRDLSHVMLEMARGGGMYLHPAVAWIQRGISLILLLISVERLSSHFAAQRELPAPVLTASFLAYWAATVAAPALFGAHPQLSHEYLYSLVLGVAALLAQPHERERVVGAVRSALFVFLLAGVAMAVVNPPMVLDMNYRQGLLPGVPRFAGLAAHAVAIGIFAQAFLLCLWAQPFRRRWLNVLAWTLGFGVLFVAQSKTSWIGMILCSTAMLAVRHGGSAWRRVGDPRDSGPGIVTCLAVIVAVVSLLALLLGTDVATEATDYLQTPDGAQLATLTGRDQIWAIALEEWRASPAFGYGPGLWDDQFRAAINMPYATHAHNQFMDTAARSGVIGIAGLVFYSIVLLVLSVRTAKATGGLSLALFIALALRSISEVPLLIFGYGTELFTHLLLIITVASAARSPRAVRTAPAQRQASHRALA